MENGGKNNSGKTGCPEKRGEKRQWSLTGNGVSIYKNMEAKKKSEQELDGVVKTSKKCLGQLGNRWQHHLSKERMSTYLPGVLS